MRTFCLVLFTSLTLFVACSGFDELSTGSVDLDAMSESVDDEYDEGSKSSDPDPLDEGSKSTEFEKMKDAHTPMTFISGWDFARYQSPSEQLQILKVEGGENNGLCWRRTNLLDKSERFGRLLPDAVVEQAYLQGLLDDQFLVITTRDDGSRRFLYKMEEHSRKFPESEEIKLVERFTFRFTPDGVLTVHDNVLGGDDDVIFTYLAGQTLEYFSRGTYKWKLVWDAETSWSRECIDMRISREVDEDGNILGYWITCDSGNEFLRPGRGSGGVR